jgi:hypothetical protein
MKHEPSWTCRSGEVVVQGDLVTISFAGTTDLVVRIIDGFQYELFCEPVWDSQLGVDSSIDGGSRRRQPKLFQVYLCCFGSTKVLIHGIA